MKILNRSMIRSLEKNAAESGIFSYEEMMENAGCTAFDILADNYDFEGKKVLVALGNGNNGGDGAVIAEKLSKICETEIYRPFGNFNSYPAKNFEKSISDIKKTETLSDKYDYVIDALFGIGLNRPLDLKTQEVIKKLNDLSGIKISVDIPSGIDCDAEAGQTNAFKADFTVTFIALKPCFVLPPFNDIQL